VFNPRTGTTQLAKNQEAYEARREDEEEQDIRKKQILWEPW
jgi:hypothetical protein